MSDNLSVKECDDEKCREQLYDLNWNYHDVVLLNGINNFQISGCLTDITLAADNRSIKAHKLILASCSPYFFQLFKEMENVQHPVVILQDVAYDDICSIVSYMYQGKCIVSSSRLQEVLSVAKLLKIRGLCDFPHDHNHQYQQEFQNRHLLSNSSSLVLPPLVPKCNNLPDLVHLEQRPTSTSRRNCMTKNVEINAKKDDTRVISVPFSSPPILSHNLSMATSTKRSASTSPTQVNVAQLSKPAVNVDQELSKLKTEAVASITEAVAQTKISLSSQLPSSLPLPPIDVSLKHTVLNTSTAQLLKKLKQVDSICFICGKQLSNQYNLRVHLETHQSGYYACQSCPHISRSKDALRKHVSYRHSPSGTISKRKLQQK